MAVDPSIHVQQMNLSQHAPWNKVGDFVRWIFIPRDYGRRAHRHRLALEEFRGMSAQVEINIWVSGIANLTPLGEIRRQIEEYHGVNHDNKQREDDTKRERRRRKGPGFEFL